MRISGIGLNVLDELYLPVDFESEAFQRYRSQSRGDGGLEPGRLVLGEDFERYIGKHYQPALEEITEGRGPQRRNIGGPPIVALILASQVLEDCPIDIDYSGAVGDDEKGRWMLEHVKLLPLQTPDYITMPGETQVTLVMSDPAYDHGRGERSFIINLGVSEEYGPEHVPEHFFSADIAVIGATALVPRLHQDLDNLVKRAKDNGAITVVTTVFDFKNERANPDKPWPLGQTKHTCAHTDLLMMDREEALAISGRGDMRAAAQYFREAGVDTTIITHGANTVLFYSEGNLFEAAPLSELPVSEEVARRMEENPELRGDTTGCGDNFCGGVIASLATQMKQRPKAKPNLFEAVAAGVVSGGAACFHV
ncbi:MAG: carbohydrate kinase family protein, partial [Candidatus Sumerlaeota bacterium]